MNVASLPSSLRARLTPFGAPVLALCAWTAFVWVTRIRNAFTADDISSGGKAIALFTSLAFVAAAGVVAGTHLVRHPLARRLAVAFALAGIAYWAIRMVVIIGRGNSFGFVLVHALLAAVTAGLGVWVVRAATGRTGRAHRSMRHA